MLASNAAAMLLSTAGAVVVVRGARMRANNVDADDDADDVDDVLEPRDALLSSSPAAALAWRSSTSVLSMRRDRERAATALTTALRAADIAPLALVGRLDVVALVADVEDAGAVVDEADAAVVVVALLLDCVDDDVVVVVVVVDAVVAAASPLGKRQRLIANWRHGTST